MSKLLIVHHSPSANLEKILHSAFEGSHHKDITGVEVVVKTALEATSEDVLAADAYLLGTSANFGYISGALKHFFDSTFNDAHEQTQGRPFSFWIHGNFDTTGALNAMRSITTGYGWNLSAEPLIFTGEVSAERLSEAFELGATMAAVISE